MKITVTFNAGTDVYTVQKLEAVVRDLPYVYSILSDYSQERPSSEKDWSMVTVAYVLQRISKSLADVSPHEVEYMQSAIKEKQLLKMVKIIRDLTGLSLTNSKELIESMLK